MSRAELERADMPKVITVWDKVFGVYSYIRAPAGPEDWERQLLKEMKAGESQSCLAVHTASRMNHSRNLL